jgi:hypothetical protein
MAKVSLERTGPIADRLNAWVNRARQDVKTVVDTAQHRMDYGSPPLLDPSEDVGLSPNVSLSAKQERIFRRRELLGLENEPYTRR